MIVHVNPEDFYRAWKKRHEKDEDDFDSMPQYLIENRIILDFRFPVNGLEFIRNRDLTWRVVRTLDRRRICRADDTCPPQEFESMYDEYYAMRLPIDDHAGILVCAWRLGW